MKMKVLVSLFKRIFSPLLVLLIVIVCMSYTCYKSETISSLYGKDRDHCADKSCGAGGDDPGDNSEVGEKSAANLSNNHDNPPKHDSEIPTDYINVIITFTNAEHNRKLQAKFTQTVSSLLDHASVPVAIHVLGDPASQKIAKQIIDKHAMSTPDKEHVYQVKSLDVHQLAQSLNETIGPMQKHFSYKPGAYYNHVLFFMSIAIHRVMPEEYKKIIMLDADLKFMADIKHLYEHFDLFTPENIIGIGNDLQPVYKHTFWQYRKENPGTRVGEPAPEGLQGFNSGVLLLDLERMKQSKLYNSLITAEGVEELTKEFHFKGHLGDQDFFTLIGMKYEELFYVLPCEWNRQLCVWWRDHGYRDVFDLYFTCDREVKIYHGNCNTPIP